jgi:peptide/nickel transport system ATP-binding protein/oligopeptide transport system ATP-binding protein
LPKLSEQLLLEIKNLKVNFNTYLGIVQAVDIDHFSIGKKECVGLVGETGCGKSVTALSILKLLPPSGKIISGQILFKGEDLLKKSPNEMEKIRGKQISVIFQNPFSSLNPVFTVGEQIIRILMLHQHLCKEEAKKKAVEMFNMMRLSSSRKLLNRYPHELSGGMCQRVMIAMALSCNPDLLIADEPTTALDVTIQAQILKLMRELKEKIAASVLLITHDLAVVAQLCDKVAVMYAGRIIERGTVKDIFKNPAHPYTQGLLEAIPMVGKKERELKGIHGFVPDMLNPPTGCRFHPRCQYAINICKIKPPTQIRIENEHFVSCFLYTNGGKSNFRTAKSSKLEEILPS